ncbi:MAG: Eco57I restriction-modification methylase domain-containing protein [Terriglobales bacterium]
MAPSAFARTFPSASKPAPKPSIFLSTLQAALDSQKTQAERNRLGPFATPNALARDVLKYARSLLPPREAIHFLDPAIGTGSFYSALLSELPPQCISEATGFELDPHYGKPAAALWKSHSLLLKLADFTSAPAQPRFSLIICNPPNVRHHHLQHCDKSHLQLQAQQSCGVKLSGLAGLYCYFMALAHGWMTSGAVAGWLVPSEFMDVNYGRTLKQYLLERVTLLHIHRFDPNDVQFADALVSSAVVWLRNAPPPKNHAVTFTFGGSLQAPKHSRSVPAHALAHEPKWTCFPAADVRTTDGLPTIADFFKIKRGLATGNNDFFILSEEQINDRGLPMETFTPVLPSPRFLAGDEVTPDRHGNPNIERRRFLLDTKLPEEIIKHRFPALHAYLEEGRAQGLHERYLCKHRPIWYAQENRPPAPIVCTYIGRGDTESGRPFRFILNRSRATVANVYLAIYPTPTLARALAHDPDLIRRIWKELNVIAPEQLLGESRVCGGGLHKLEPKELANVPVPTLAAIIPQIGRLPKQTDMLAQLAV